MSQYHGFKKVSDDREKAVMRHPNGHTITIAKKALSRAHLSELERLPLYQADPDAPVGESADDTSMKASEGGHQTIINVGVPQAPPAPTVPAPAPNNLLNTERKKAGVMPQQDTPADIAAATKNTDAAMPGAAQQSPAAPAPAPAGPAAPTGSPEAGLPQPAAIAPIQLSPGDQFVDQMRKWSQDLAIHPQTYRQLLWYQHNPDGSPILDKSGQPVEKGFFGKLGTVFGLLMGGIGSGLAHQPNMMMQIMDEQIKNNLAAQEKSKQNELSFGNLLDQHLTSQVEAKKGQADINHLALQDSVTRAQFKLSAARRATVQRLYDDIVSKYPEGSDGWNRGMQALGQLSSSIDAQDQAAAPMINARFQYYKSLMGNPSEGGAGVPTGQVDMDKLNQLERQSLLKAPGALPQGEIEQMDKEADDVRNIQQLKADFMQTFDELEGMHLKGALAPKIKAAKTDALLARASKVGEGRYTEASNKSYHSLLPDKLDGPNTGPVKRKAAESFFDDLIGKKTVLERHNIWHPSGQTGQTNQSGGQTKTMHGAQYRKVPGGWQKIK